MQKQWQLEKLNTNIEENFNFYYKNTLYLNEYFEKSYQHVHDQMHSSNKEAPQARLADYSQKATTVLENFNRFKAINNRQALSEEPQPNEESYGLQKRCYDDLRELKKHHGFFERHLEITALYEDLRPNFPDHPNMEFINRLHGLLKLYNDLSSHEDGKHDFQDDMSLKFNHTYPEKEADVMGFSLRKEFMRAFATGWDMDKFVVAQKNFTENFLNNKKLQRDALKEEISQMDKHDMEAYEQKLNLRHEFHIQTIKDFKEEHEEFMRSLVNEAKEQNHPQKKLKDQDLTLCMDYYTTRDTYCFERLMR